MPTIFCSNSHENPGTNLFCQVCGEKLSQPAISYLVAGAILEGRYRLVQQIGQGGFGRTYLCEDLNRFNEPCVLKEFAPQVHGTTALDKAKNLFEREANVLYQLQHPQIPKFRELFQMTTGGGGLFLVQDYVAGHTYRYALNSRLQQNQTFREDEVRRLLVHLLPVLEYTHSLGVIHRDIAPDNLIIRSSDGLPVLIDFGGVKQIAVNAEIQALGNTEALTRLGKVGYAPNEQMQRGTVSPHSDLYALAATCLVLLTGQEPTSLLDPKTMNWQWRRFIQLSPDLEQIFDRMLQAQPSDRMQSATEVLQALQNPPPQTPPTLAPLPVTLPMNKPMAASNVVMSPNNQQVLASPHKKNTFVSSSAVTTNMGSNGWRKMLNPVSVGLVGTLAAIGLVWGAVSNVSKPKTIPTTAISPESSSPVVLSDSPSPDSSASPEVTTTPETPSSELSPAILKSPSGESSEEAPAVESTPRSRRRSRRSRINSESSPSKSEKSGQSSKSETSESATELEQPKTRRRRRRVVTEETTPERSTTPRKRSEKSNAPSLEGGNNRKAESVEKEPRTRPVRPDKPDKPEQSDQPERTNRPDKPDQPEPKDEPAGNDNEPTITQPKPNEAPLF